MEGPTMPTALRAFLFAFFVAAGCCLLPAASSQSPSLPALRAAHVENSVRAFMRTVAHDVTQEVPAAWSRYFAETPAFFMAVDGHLVFPDSAAASRGIRQAAQEIKRIQLVWGSDLRVDPFTANFAVVASSWHEVQLKADGQRLDESGFFTAVAELRDRRWQFRDAIGRSPPHPRPWPSTDLSSLKAAHSPTYPFTPAVLGWLFAFEEPDSPCNPVLPFTSISPLPPAPP
jgi:hypothetical protein